MNMKPAELAVLVVFVGIIGAGIALIAEHTVFRDRPQIAVGAEDGLLCKPFGGVKKQTQESRFSSPNLRSTLHTVEMECFDGSTVRRAYWE